MTKTCTHPVRHVTDPDERSHVALMAQQAFDNDTPIYARLLTETLMPCGTNGDDGVTYLPDEATARKVVRNQMAYNGPKLGQVDNAVPAMPNGVNLVKRTGLPKRRKGRTR